MSLLPDILKPLLLNSHVLPRAYYSWCLQGFCLFIKGRFMALEHIGVHQEWDFTVSLRDGATPNIPTDASPAASSQPEADQQNFQAPRNALEAHSWGLLPTLRKGSHLASLLTHLLRREGARRAFCIPSPSVKRFGEWSWPKRPLQTASRWRSVTGGASPCPLPQQRPAARRCRQTSAPGSRRARNRSLSHTHAHTHAHTQPHTPGAADGA